MEKAEVMEKALEHLGKHLCQAIMERMQNMPNFRLELIQILKHIVLKQKTLEERIESLEHR